MYCLKPEGTNKNRSTVSCAYKKFFKIKNNNSNKKDLYDQNNALFWAPI